MDFYNLKNDWENHKTLTDELEKDLENFVKRPMSRKWGAFIRKKSKEIDRLGKRIKKNIILQRQDYQSDYS